MGLPTVGRKHGVTCIACRTPTVAAGPGPGHRTARPERYQRAGLIAELRRRAAAAGENASSCAPVDTAPTPGLFRCRYYCSDQAGHSPPGRSPYGSRTGTRAHGSLFSPRAGSWRRAWPTRRPIGSAVTGVTGRVTTRFALRELPRCSRLRYAP